MSWRRRRKPPTAPPDQNQEAIVRTLFAVGATVQNLAPMGNGCPDLLVGYRRQTFLLEVKRVFVPGEPSMRERDVQLRDSQRKWHANWRGWPVAVVRTPEEALTAIGAVKGSIEVCGSKALKAALAGIG